MNAYRDDFSMYLTSTKAMRLKVTVRSFDCTQFVMNMSLDRICIQVNVYSNQPNAFGGGFFELLHEERTVH